MNTSEPYKYTKLNDIALTDRCNVIAVIKFARLPSQKKNGHHIFMTLTDETIFTSKSSKLASNFFFTILHNSQEIRAYRIVRVHRLKIEEYQGTTQGICICGGHFLIFDDNLNSTLEPLYSSSNKYSPISESEAARIKELRRWISENKRLLDRCEDDAPVRFSEAEPGQFFVNVSQLLSCKYNGTLKAYVMHVADGTSPTRKTHRNVSLKDIIDQKTWNCSLAGLELLVVEVLVDKSFADELLQIKDGDFIKLRSLHVYLHSDRTDSDGCLSYEICKGAPHIEVMPSTSPEAQEIISRLSLLRAPSDKNTNNNNNSISSEAHNNNAKVNVHHEHPKSSCNSAIELLKKIDSFRIFSRLSNDNRNSISNEEELLRCGLVQTSQKLEEEKDGKDMERNSRSQSIQVDSDVFDIPMIHTDKSLADGCSQTCDLDVVCNAHNNKDNDGELDSSYMVYYSSSDGDDAAGDEGRHAGNESQVEEMDTGSVEQFPQNQHETEVIERKKQFEPRGESNSQNVESGILPSRPSNTQTTDNSVDDIKRSWNGVVVSSDSSLDCDEDDVYFRKDSQGYAGKAERDLLTMRTLHESREICTLGDVLKTPPPKNFRVKAKVLKYFPKPDVSSPFVQLYCSLCKSFLPLDCTTGKNQLKKCTWSCKRTCSLAFHCDLIFCRRCKLDKKMSVMRHVYTFQVLLTDTSGVQLCANLWGEEADNFLGNICPKRAIGIKSEMKVLKEMMDGMVGSVVDCCISSSTHEGKALYQIFDTFLSTCK